MASKQDIQNQIDLGLLKGWRKDVNKRLDSIDKKLEDLPKQLIVLLDERYAPMKDFTEMQETVEPLTTLRKRIWYFMLAVFVAEAFALLVLTTNLKDWVK